ncbi:Unknown protein [Striga hermonthica]|uniref:Uncharacterized protein n=1 Tax=Striga hermonthica TaxID=68872 RepID=A0A9N7NSY9_STRHE|nr:Unknown protein [Striga hermonthica]
MAVSAGNSYLPPDASPFELKTEADFDRIVSPDGLISVCGFGSLLSAKPETKETSSLSMEPCEGETLVVNTFEIQRSEIPSFIEREHEFRFLAVTPETFNGLLYTTPSVLCARYSDEEYFMNRCEGNKDIFFQRYGRYGIDKIWLDDILPCRVLSSPLVGTL